MDDRKVRYTITCSASLSLEGGVAAAYYFIRERWPMESLEDIVSETEMVATFDDKTPIDPLALFEQME